MNSFNPSSIESFVFIFNPFLMGILLFIKVLLPFLPTCAGLLAVIRLGFLGFWGRHPRMQDSENHKKNWKFMFFFHDESDNFTVWYDESEFLLPGEGRRKLARCWSLNFEFFNCLAYEYKYNIDNGTSKLSNNKVIHCQPKTSITYL